MTGRRTGFGRHGSTPVDQPGEHWSVRAGCRNDPDLFFENGTGAVEQAKRLCRRCPVRQDCLLESVRRDDPVGIFGGLGPTQRRRLEVRDGRLVNRRVTGRVCRYCQRPLPADALPRARYCSQDCRRRAGFERQAATA